MIRGVSLYGRTENKEEGSMKEEKKSQVEIRIPESRDYAFITIESDVKSLTNFTIGEILVKVGNQLLQNENTGN